jgi:hypothetical protein
MHLRHQLIANVVRHARTPSQLNVSHFAHRLHVAVRDRSADPALLAAPVLDVRSHGRGLMLVDALAAYWGCTPTADGKVTWATLPAR